MRHSSLIGLLSIGFYIPSSRYRNQAAMSCIMGLPLNLAYESGVDVGNAQRLYLELRNEQGLNTATRRYSSITCVLINALIRAAPSLGLNNDVSRHIAYCLV